jgi:putative copper export protein
VLSSGAAVGSTHATEGTSDRAREGSGRVPLVAHVDNDSPLGIGYVVVRALTFASLLVLVGAVVFRLIVLPRATMDEALALVISQRAAVVGAIVSVALVLSAAVRLVLQAQIFNENRGAAPLSFAQIIGGTQWGGVWLMQVLAALGAVVGFVVARKSKVGWAVTGVCAVVLSITPALAGHAAAAADYSLLAIVTDAMHVFAASGWLGSLFLVAMIGIPTIVLSGTEECWGAVASLVKSFSPAALTSAGLVVITGTVNAWLRLGSLSALWSSGYGQTLLLKLLVLAAVAGTGAYNWRRVRPGLGTNVATRRLQRSAAIELLAGAVVICITAVLVAIEPPIQ